MQFVDGKYWTIVRPLLLSPPPPRHCARQKAGWYIFHWMRGNDSSTSQQIYIYMYMCVYIPDFSSASTLNKSNFIQRISSCARDTVSWIRRFNDGTRSMANFFSKVWKAFSKKFMICILERWCSSIVVLDVQEGVQSPMVFLSGYVGNEFLRRDPLWNLLFKSWNIPNEGGIFVGNCVWPHREIQLLL